MDRILALLISITMIGVYSASGQIGSITRKITEKPKAEQTQKPANEKANPSSQSNAGAGNQENYKDSDFLYMGKNEMAGQRVAGMKACVIGGNDRFPPPVSKQFTNWITAISETAALRSFGSATCPVVAVRIYDHPAYKYKNIDSLTETAQGNSIYKVEAGELVLVRKIAASEFYIVVVPDHNKPGLKLADLRLCGYPDTIKLFRRRVHTVVNCHDQKQKLYVFEQYKSYPGPMQTGSVLFDAAEFTELNKQGKFKGLVVYKLVGDDLVGVK